MYSTNRISKDLKCLCDYILYNDMMSLKRLEVYLYYLQTNSIVNKFYNAENEESVYLFTDNIYASTLGVDIPSVKEYVKEVWKPNTMFVLTRRINKNKELIDNMIDRLDKYHTLVLCGLIQNTKVWKKCYYGFDKKIYRAYMTLYYQDLIDKEGNIVGE